MDADADAEADGRAVKHLIIQNKRIMAKEMKNDSQLISDIFDEFSRENRVWKIFQLGLLKIMQS